MYGPNFTKGYQGRGIRMGSVVVLPTGEASVTRQGLRQFEGISAESVGSRALCAHLLAIPPGGRAKAHRHAGHETAIYLMEGRAVLWFGEQLESRIDAGPGDFVYIPPDVPHLPVNASDTEWARGVVARTDPNEQESVELLPDLDGLPHLVP
jgi:uncharacterized RmlC-like cupin family protein